MPFVPTLTLLFCLGNTFQVKIWFQRALQDKLPLSIFPWSVAGSGSLSRVAFGLQIGLNCSRWRRRIRFDSVL